MDCSERSQLPCIGLERADLVVAGCAILEAICRLWPVGRVRVADRGLREGILFRRWAAIRSVILAKCLRFRDWLTATSWAARRQGLVAPLDGEGEVGRQAFRLVHPLVGAPARRSLCGRSQAARLSLTGSVQACRA